MTFKSSKKKVATVDKAGKIVAKKRGTTKITIRVGKKKIVKKLKVK
ncbi:MAG: Ig-like domain-containing protein [Actinomycetes bacterium]|nr:Ig-like domain-containing protein [Actinomycetes bacterium]